MDKLTAIKIKYADGTYSDEIPVSVLSENVEWDSAHTLVDVLGSIDVDITGTIQDQISRLVNEKVSATQLQNYVASQLNEDVLSWLNTNVNPVGSAVVVDSSLTISGAAADAKIVGDNISDLKSTFDKIENVVSIDYKNGYYAESDGGYHNSSYFICSNNYIDTTHNKIIEIYNGVDTVSIIFLSLWSGDTFKRNISFASESGLSHLVYVVPADINKVYVNFMSKTYHITPKQFVAKTIVLNKNTDYDFNSSFDKIENVVSIDYKNGYYAESDGGYHNSSSFICSDNYIDTTHNKIIEIYNGVTLEAIFLSLWSGDTFKRNISFTSESELSHLVYVVPADINKVYVNFRRNTYPITPEQFVAKTIVLNKNTNYDFNSFRNAIASRYDGYKLSIIGDSIDTFDQQGYKIDGYDMFYPSGGVTDVEETWWKQVINTSGMTLEVNASYSGSGVTNAVQKALSPDFYNRVSLIGNPDVVFIALGANDSIANVPLGEYDFETEYSQLSESEFRPAYIKGIRALQASYPNAKIVCVVKAMWERYAESIRVIAQKFGAEYIDVRGYTSTDTLHPNRLGMRQIASEVLQPTDKSLSFAGIPADSKAIGDALNEIEQRLPKAEGFLQAPSKNILPIGKDYDPSTMLIAFTRQDVSSEIASKGGVDAPCVFWDSIEGRWGMTFTGYRQDDVNIYGSIYAAHSDDLENWVQDGVIIERDLSLGEGGYEYGTVSGSYVFIKNGTYYVYYNAGSTRGFETGKHCICVATGTSLNNLTKYSGNPLLVGSEEGKWFSKEKLYRPSVIQWQDGTYYMFFNARNSEIDTSDGRVPGSWHEYIGYAVSTDLLNWEIQDRAVYWPERQQYKHFVTGDPSFYDIGDEYIYATIFTCFSQNSIDWSQTGIGIIRTLKEDFPLGWEVKWNTVTGYPKTKASIVYKNGTQYAFMVDSGPAVYYRKAES